MATSFLFPAHHGIPAEGESAFIGFHRRATAGECLNVVFFGGSLTWGAQATDPQHTSYRALVGRQLEKEYPSAHFRCRDSAIGGTGSQLGAFRLERDVLRHKPDLVFLDFTVNDGPFDSPDPDKLASYEALVRKMVGAGIPVVQMILGVKRDVLPGAPERALDEKHKEIAHAYGLPVGDAVSLMKQRVRDKQADPDTLWPLPEDQTHPGDAGYALYAEAAWAAFKEAVSSGACERVPAKMLHADTYLTANRVRLSSLPVLPQGWKVGMPHRSGCAFDFVMSRWLDDVCIASMPEGGSSSPEMLVMDVRCRNVMLFGEATPKSGKYLVKLDGGEAKEFNVGAIAKSGNIRYVETIASGLNPDTAHHLEITPVLKPGEELRLESLCISGAPGAFTVTPSLKK